MARLKLLGSRLLVKPITPSIQSNGGIFYDMSRQDDRKRWEVIDVGPKVKDIKPGDKVIVHGNVESLFTWTDDVMVINSSDAVATW